MAPESIISKAQKIQALLDGAKTEGEAAAAAAALTRLMTKYHIEEYQLHGAAASEVRYQRFDLGKGGRPTWRRGLFAIIARANGCETVYWSNTNDIGIVGRQTQIEIVYDLYIRLRTAILRLAKEGYKEYCEEIERNNAQLRLEGWSTGIRKPDHVPVWNHSFCMGANVTLQRRLRTARTGETAEETALVQVMDAEVEASFKERFPNVRSNKSRFVLSRDGWSAGSAAGNNLNLGKSVNGGANVRALG